MMVDPDPIIHECQVAKHKLEVKECETYLGVENALRIKIKEAVDSEWLEAIQSAMLGFTHVMPLAMLTHLQSSGVNLDFIDDTDLMTKLMTTWEVTENPATKFAHDDKIEQQLVKVGLMAQPALCLALAMSAFKATGKYNAQIHKFQAKPTMDKTFDNF